MPTSIYYDYSRTLCCLIADLLLSIFHPPLYVKDDKQCLIHSKRLIDTFEMHKENIVQALPTLMFWFSSSYNKVFEYNYL